MSEQPDVIVPPMIYLPIQEDAELENVPAMRMLADGRTALLAFSALDRLVNECGPNQQWAVVHLSEVEEIKKTVPFDAMVLDPLVPPEAVKDGKLA